MYPAHAGSPIHHAITGTAPRRQRAATKGRERARPVTDDSSAAPPEHNGLVGAAQTSPENVGLGLLSGIQTLSLPFRPLLWVEGMLAFLVPLFLRRLDAANELQS
jgi:hypothetical protein